jgi:hypothetical protein
MTLALACAGSGADDPDRREPLAKADVAGSCSDTLCGGQSEAGCWCDDRCADLGDCCSNVAQACGFDECHVGGDTGCQEAEQCVPGPCLPDCMAPGCCTPDRCVASPVACCDPRQMPGLFGNDFCIEGATCVQDGSWQCNGPGGPPEVSPGQICALDACCDPAMEPGFCARGPICCSNGAWICGDPASGESICAQLSAQVGESCPVD